MTKHLTLILVAVLAFTGCRASQASESPESSTTTVLKDITILVRESTGDAVATAACAADEVVMGGGCACTGSAGAYQSGSLFGCMVNNDGNAYVGGCYDDWQDQAYNPITVRVQCAKGETTEVLHRAPGAHEEPPVDELFEQMSRQAADHRARMQ